MDSELRKLLIEDIYYLFKNNIELSDDELRIVYGLDMPDFDADSSKLSKEIIASRCSIRGDLARLLSTSEDKITIGMFDEIPNKTVIYHYGDLELNAETIDNFDFPGYVFGSLIVDGVSRIDKYSDGPNGEKNPEKVCLPYYIQKDFIMGSLEEAYRVEPPRIVGRNVDLRSLKVLELPIGYPNKCVVYGDVDLSSTDKEEIADCFNCHGEIKQRNNIK